MIDMKTHLLILSLITPSFAFADDVRQLSPTVVTATRIETNSFDLPLSIDSVSGEDVRDARLGANLSEVAPKVPGVVINWRGGAAQELSISTRGFGARSQFGAKGVRIYADGIPLTTPDGQGQLGAINLDTLGSIEFLRGPFSVLYGNSSGGVVQAFTRQGSLDPTITASASHGSYSTNRDSITVEGQAGQLNYILSTSQLNTDGYRDHSEFRKDNFNSKLTYKVNTDTKLTLIGNYMDQPYTADPVALAPTAFVTNPKQAGTNAVARNTRLYRLNRYEGIVLDHNISESDSLRVMLYEGARKNLQYLNTNAASGIDRNTNGVDIRWTRKVKIFDKPLTLTAGINYDSMDDIRTRYTTSNGVLGSMTRKENQSAFNVDEFIQASFEPSENWLILAGLRNSRINISNKDQITSDGIDSTGSVKYTNTSPVVGLTYKVNPSLNIYANYGKGFETPTFAETTYSDTSGNGPNLSMVPSKSKNYEIGFKTFITSNTRLNAAVFKVDTKNEIVTVANSGSINVYNSIANTERNGVEIAIDSRLPFNFNFYEAYTYLDAEFKNSFTSTAGTANIGNRLAGTYRNTSYTELSWKYPAYGLQAAVENIYYGDTNGYDSNNAAYKAEAFSLINLRATLKQELGNWRFSEFARIENLGNKNYVSNVKVNSSDTFEPGNNRNYTVGVSTSYIFK